MTWQNSKVIIYISFILFYFIFLSGLCYEMVSKKETISQVFTNLLDNIGKYNGKI